MKRRFEASCFLLNLSPPSPPPSAPLLEDQLKEKPLQLLKLTPDEPRMLHDVRWTQMMTRQIEMPKNVERGEEVRSLFVFFNSVPKRFDKDCGRLNPLHHKISVHVFDTLATRFLWY